MKKVIALLMSIIGYLGSIQDISACDGFDSKTDYYNINGIYVSLDREIIIQDSILRYTQYLSDKDSLVSNCIIKRVDRDFIEVSSQPSDFRVSYSEQYLNYDSPDSISVRLLFPTKRQLFVRAYIDSIVPRVSYKKYELTNDGYFEICVPKEPHEKAQMIVSVVMLGTEYFYPGNPSRSKYKFSFLHDHISLDNSIEISFTGLDEDYFNRAYIRGEYMRVLPDSLVWNDCVFLKRKIDEEGMTR